MSGFFVNKSKPFYLTRQRTRRSEREPRYFRGFLILSSRFPEGKLLCVFVGNSKSLSRSVAGAEKNLLWPFFCRLRNTYSALRKQLCSFQTGSGSGWIFHSERDRKAIWARRLTWVLTTYYLKEEGKLSKPWKCTVRMPCLLSGNTTT